MTSKDTPRMWAAFLDGELTADQELALMSRFESDPALRADALQDALDPRKVS